MGAKVRASRLQGQVRGSDDLPHTHTHTKQVYQTSFGSPTLCHPCVRCHTTNVQLRAAEEEASATTGQLARLQGQVAQLQNDLTQAHAEMDLKRAQVRATMLR